jgi:methyl-accepting chemotaxis protein
MTALAKSIGEAITQEIDPQHLIDRTANVIDMLCKIGEAVEHQAEASRTIAQAIQQHAEEIRQLAAAVNRPWASMLGWPNARRTVRASR